MANTRDLSSKTRLKCLERDYLLRRDADSGDELAIWYLRPAQYKTNLLQTRCSGSTDIVNPRKGGKGYPKVFERFVSLCIFLDTRESCARQHQN